MSHRAIPRSLALAVIAAVVACFSAQAADRVQSFGNIKSLVIRDFTGGVEVKVGGKSVEVSLADGAKTYPVTIEDKHGTLIVAGEKRPHDFQLSKELDWRRYGDNAFKVYLKDYPRVTITAPAGTDLEFDDAIVIASVGSLKSHGKIDGGYVEAVLGDMRSADIGIVGAGNISMGAIADRLDLAINGSGDFEAVSAGSADVAVRGSGDVRLGPIAGKASFSIAGSGDVDAASVGGAIDVAINGSGDVYAGSVGGGGELTIAGSGDISLDRLNGPTSATIAGGGDIGVKDGRAENLHVNIAGSGDFTFGGVSTNLNARVMGSGEVSVAKNEGSLSYSGHDGRIRVGGKRLRTSD